MPRLSLDVGRIIHASSQHLLKLCLSYSIQLSHVLGAGAPMTEPIGIEQLKSGGWWVTRGDGLRLDIDLALDGIIKDDLERQKFIEELGVILRDAEIWSQLELSPSLTIPARRANGSAQPTEILLSLRHNQTLRPNKYSTTANNKHIDSDIKPPDGILCAYLEEVKIRLDFSKSRQKKRKRRKKVGETSENIEAASDINISSTNKDYSFHSERHCQSQPTPSLMLSNSWSSLDQRLCSSQPLPLSGEAMLDDNSDSSYIFDCGPSAVALIAESTGALSQYPNTSVNGLLSQKSKRRSSTSELPISCGLDLTDFMKLIDASLRKMISDYKTPLPSGVKLIHKTFGPSLAEISPALFSPGYLQAVSQRSCFISTIASSIASVTVRSSTSAASASRIEDLTEQTIFPGTRSAIGSASQVEAKYNHFFTSLKPSLWKMIQCKLYQPLAARQLKPFQSLPSHKSENLNHLNEMLDESSSPTTPVEPSLSLAHENSMGDFDMLLENAEDVLFDSDNDLLDEHDCEEADEEDNETEPLDKFPTAISPSPSSSSRTLGTWDPWPWPSQRKKDAAEDLLFSDSD